MKLYAMSYWYVIHSVSLLAVVFISFGTGYYIRNYLGDEKHKSLIKNFSVNMTLGYVLLVSVLGKT